MDELFEEELELELLELFELEFELEFEELFELELEELFELELLDELELEFEERFDERLELELLELLEDELPANCWPSSLADAPCESARPGRSMPASDALAAAHAAPASPRMAAAVLVANKAIFFMLIPYLSRYRSHLGWRGLNPS